MKVGAPVSFGAQLKALREAAGFTEEELARIAGLSIHAVSALERGERALAWLGPVGPGLRRGTHAVHRFRPGPLSIRH
jgi:helix-turn-helix protein